MIQQMIALRAGGGAIGQADKQQALADQLRNDARGRLDAKRIPSSTGGMVVAPTWGSALGSVADQYRAYKLDEKANTARGKVDTDRAAASEALFNAMRKRGGASWPAFHTQRARWIPWTRPGRDTGNSASPRNWLPNGKPLKPA
jgi:hypothetical protein